MDDNPICNTFCLDRLTLAPYNARGSDRTERERYTKIAINRRNEDETTKNSACIIRELEVEHIGKHVRTGRKMEYIARWYRFGYGPDADTVEQLKDMSEYFIARFWSILIRRNA